VDPAEVKQRQRRIWGLGDYSHFSRLLRPAAETLCEACEVSEGHQVLDAAAGDGNFALAAAARGARVVASDLSPGMVERGRGRSRSERREIDWVEADVEELPFEDARFDRAGSVFGAMLAPQPEVAAAELFRVIRPGGLLGMTAWTPDSFVVGLFQIGRRYQPAQAPPRGGASEEWGDEETACARLSPHADSVELERLSIRWELDSLEAFERMDDSAPNTAALRRALPPERFEAMREEQRALVRDWAGGDGPIAIEAAYLQIVARKRESS
jgi:SAM-dependent methyltransferase